MQVLVVQNEVISPVLAKHLVLKSINGLEHPKRQHM